MKKDLNKFIENSNKVAEILKEMSHPVRLRLLCYLFEKEKVSVEDITSFCEISQPQVSHFLKRLKDKKIVSFKREKNTYYYTIEDENIKEIIKSLNKIYC